MAYSTNGFVFGHAAVPTAFAVGAIADVSPNTFYKKQQTMSFLVPEVYTSEGPRRIMYMNGFAVTPNDVSWATGGYTRWKPDIVAADEVDTVIPNFQLYYGTSASAAQAAGIAALCAQAYPYLTFSQLQLSFYETNVPAMGSISYENNITNLGIPDAVPLIAYISKSLFTWTLSNIWVFLMVVFCCIIAASDECASNPCLNGGTCHDWFKSYTCTCPDIYCGVNCQNPC